MQISLRKITQIGEQYISKYRMPNGSLQRVWITKEEYEALGKKGAGEPPHKPHSKAIWLNSRITPLFDNPSGFQEIGDIWEEHEGQFQILAGDPYDRSSWVMLNTVDNKKIQVSGTSPDITVIGLEGVEIADGILVK